MEFMKMLLVFSCVGMHSTMVSSAPRISSLSKRASDVQILVFTELASRINDVLTEMQKLHPFITRNLLYPAIDLKLRINSECLRYKKLEDKLSVLYHAFSKFQSPLHMAYAFEESQGPQHDSLVLTLRKIMDELNSMVSIVNHKLQEAGVHLSRDHMALSEKQMDHSIRLYLQETTNLSVTDILVKIYRDYVIICVLYDVIFDVIPCLEDV